MRLFTAVVRSSWRGVASLLFALGACASPALAQSDVLTLPNHALSAAELSSLDPYLDAMIVAHVETTETVELPQVTIVARSVARCDELLDTARDVATYPTSMPAIGHLDVESATEDATTYAWTWQAAVFSFRGRASTTIIAEGDGSAGFRVVFETPSGDFGRSRRVLRGIPLASDGCLLVLASHQDFRDANYLARESEASVPTMSRTFNLMLSIATIARLRGETERRRGTPRTRIASPLGDPRARAVDAVALAPLLSRGELFLIETTDGTDLGAIVGLTQQAFPEARVRAAFLDPTRFTVGLLYGARITELAREERVARYLWAVDLALLGSSGELTIHDLAEHEVELEATAGAMRGGRLVVTTVPAGDGTLATLAARIDPADGVPIVRAIEATDPAFRPGLVASGLLMAFRGLRRGLSEGH